MNILLVRPRPHHDTIGLQKFMVCEPLELEYLSSTMEAVGHQVEILDMIFEKPGALLETVKRFAPAIIGFTAYMPHVGVVKAYARSIKAVSPAVVTVVGGVHAEVNPADFDDDAVDVIVCENGLRTFREIAAALERSDPVETIRRTVTGVWNGTAKRCFPDEPEEAPFPDRSKTERYRDRYNYVFHDRCATIKTSVGCPYECEFCYCIEIARHRYRARPIDRVVQELAAIREKNVFIVDDNFLVSIPRIQEFCRLLDEHGIVKNFIMFARADFVADHPEIIRLLKEHGLKAIFVGIESSRDSDLESFEKKTTVAINEKAVHLLDALDIECYSGIIVGPDWTRKDFDTLIAFLHQFKMPLINIQPITPIPGTSLYDTARPSITLPRQDFHLWDMAHLAQSPIALSRRAFYFNIMRAYYKTSCGFKGQWFVVRKYGPRIYLRTMRAVAYITWQYAKLVFWG